MQFEQSLVADGEVRSRGISFKQDEQTPPVDVDVGVGVVVVVSFIVDCSQSDSKREREETVHVTIDQPC